MIPDDFYKAFEDRCRGSQSDVKARQSAYLPLLEILKDNHAVGALDIGCGRGEWLSLLSNQEFAGEGVDLDATMVRTCLEKGFAVTQQDAVQALNLRQDASLALITGFHVAEHMSFDALFALVRESFRVLKPGGVLLLETPNPENISVGTSSFYMDPTHRQPLPPGLLKFVCEYCGFAPVKIIRLHERPEMLEKENPTLMDVFWESSPDYAVVAQKPGDLKATDKFENLIAKDHGLSLERLTSRYDLNNYNRSQHTLNLVEQAHLLSSQASNLAQDALLQVQQARNEAAEALALSRSVYNNRLNRAVRWLGKLLRVVRCPWAK